VRISKLRARLLKAEGGLMYTCYHLLVVSTMAVSSEARLWVTHNSYRRRRRDVRSQEKGRIYKAFRDKDGTLRTDRTDFGRLAVAPPAITRALLLVENLGPH